MANSRYIAIVEDEKEQSELLKQYLYRFAKEQEFDLQVSQFYDLQPLNHKDLRALYTQLLHVG